METADTTIYPISLLEVAPTSVSKSIEWYVTEQTEDNKEFKVIHRANASDINTQNPLDSVQVGVTSTGKSMRWYVDEQIFKGKWREEVIPSEIVGLSRPIVVFRAPRTTNLITYAWHGDKDTFCPPIWWDLAVGSGACGLGCRACFLMLTHRIKRDPWRHLLYENVESFFLASQKWLIDPQRHPFHTLGVGIDRSDSLLYEGVTGHVRRLAPLFASEVTNPKKCKLILLTKSTNTHYLKDISQNQRKNVIVSFSLNPEPVADLWEGKWPDGQRITPSIAKRLEAAAYAQELGFEIRVRIDPILTPLGWEDYYDNFVKQIKRLGVNFRYWTLGTYREKNSQLQDWASRWGLSPMEWQPEDGELVHDGTHWHLSTKRRTEIYQTVRDIIKSQFSEAKISLCKETHIIRKKTSFM
jgi:DNA repair photolyase